MRPYQRLIHAAFESEIIIFFFFSFLAFDGGIYGQNN